MSNTCTMLPHSNEMANVECVIGDLGILLSRMCADHAGPPSLQDRVLVRGRTFVVLLTPDKVPDGRDQYDSDQNNTSVVHGGGGDDLESWHAE